MRGRLLAAVVGLVAVVAAVAALRRSHAPVAVDPLDARAYIEEHDAELRRLLEGIAP